MTANKYTEPELAKALRRTALQGWVSVAVWMSVGLLLESLMAFKSPAYLEDPTRRELFRLAHAHGSLLGIVLVVASMWARSSSASLARLTVAALRLGSAVMPIGFILAGVRHPESDPGVAIWLVPIGPILLIFSIVSIALSSRTRN